MNEIITIASGTWKNVLRMKVVYFLIFCALVLVGSAYNYDVLSMGLQKELMIDVSLVLNSIAAMLVVISLTFEIPRELREGVASTLLSKPLGRFQYLFGKMIGCVVTGAVICALIAAGSFVIFHVAFGDRITVSMFQTQLLVILAMVPMSAIGVLFATVLPEVLAPILTVVAVWFAFSTRILAGFWGLYGGILPDLDLFNFRANAVYQIQIPWMYVLLVTLWGICYAAFALSLASIVFERKDIK